MRTPKNLRDEYRNLSVPLLDGTRVFGLDIHEYRNYAMPSGPFSTNAGMSEYDKLVNQIKEHCRPAGTSKQPCSLPFISNS